MRRVSVALLAALLAGCGGNWEKGDKPRNSRETAPGPGLFTGKTGQWEIIRQEPREDEEKTTAQE